MQRQKGDIPGNSNNQKSLVPQNLIEVTLDPNPEKQSATNSPKAPIMPRRILSTICSSAEASLSAELRSGGEARREASEGSEVAAARRQVSGALGRHLGVKIWVFPKIKGTFFGVPIIRTIIYWGTLSLGNYHI